MASTEVIRKELIALILRIRANVGESCTATQAVDYIRNLESLYGDYDELELVKCLQSMIESHMIGEDVQKDKLNVKNLLENKGLEPLKRNVLALVQSIVSNSADKEELEQSIASPKAKKQKSDGFSYFDQFNFDDIPPYEPLELTLSALRLNGNDEAAVAKLLETEFVDLLEHPQWDELMTLMVNCMQDPSVSESQKVSILCLYSKFIKVFRNYQSCEAAINLLQIVISEYFIKNSTQSFVNSEKQDLVHGSLLCLFVELVDNGVTFLHQASPAEKKVILLLVFTVLVQSISLMNSNSEESRLNRKFFECINPDSFAVFIQQYHPMQVLTLAEGSGLIEVLFKTVTDVKDWISSSNLIKLSKLMNILLPLIQPYLNDQHYGIIVAASQKSTHNKWVDSLKTNLLLDGDKKILSQKLLQQLLDCDAYNGRFWIVKDCSPFNIYNSPQQLENVDNIVGNILRNPLLVLIESLERVVLKDRTTEMTRHTELVLDNLAIAVLSLANLFGQSDELMTYLWRLATKLFSSSTQSEKTCSIEKFLVIIGDRMYDIPSNLLQIVIKIAAEANQLCEDIFTSKFGLLFLNSVSLRVESSFGIPNSTIGGNGIMVHEFKEKLQVHLADLLKCSMQNEFSLALVAEILSSSELHPSSNIEKWILEKCVEELRYERRISVDLSVGVLLAHVLMHNQCSVKGLISCLCEQLFLLVDECDVHYDSLHIGNNSITKIVNLLCICVITGHIDEVWEELIKLVELSIFQPSMFIFTSHQSAVSCMKLKGNQLIGAICAGISTGIELAAFYPCLLRISEVSLVDNAFCMRCRHYFMNYSQHIDKIDTDSEIDHSINLESIFVADAIHRMNFFVLHTQDPLLTSPQSELELDRIIIVSKEIKGFADRKMLSVQESCSLCFWSGDALIHSILVSTIDSLPVSHHDATWKQIKLADVDVMSSMIEAIVDHMQPFYQVEFGRSFDVNEHLLLPSDVLSRVDESKDYFLLALFLLSSDNKKRCSLLQSSINNNTFFALTDKEVVSNLVDKIKAVIVEKFPYVSSVLRQVGMNVECLANILLRNWFFPFFMPEEVLLITLGTIVKGSEWPVGIAAAMIKTTADRILTIENMCTSESVLALMRTGTEMELERLINVANDFFTK